MKLWKSYRTRNELMKMQRVGKMSLDSLLDFQYASESKDRVSIISDPNN